MFAINVYIIGFVISIILLIFSNTVWNKKANMYVIAAFWLGTIFSGGYLATACASNVEEFVLAKKVGYFGTNYLHVMVMFITMYLCKIKVTKLIAFLSMTISTIIYFFILTIGYTDWYYKSYELKRYRGCVYLEKEYGPLYSLYTIAFAVYTIICLVIAIVSLKREKLVSKKITISLICLNVAALVIYIVERLADSIIEWNVFVYSLGSLLFFILHIRVDKYDLVGRISDTMEMSKINGYIMVTKDKRFAGCNDIAKKYVKELNDMNIDSLINSENQFFSRLIAEMGYMGDKDQEAWHQRLNGKEIKCILRYLFYNDKKSGYMLELVDDTKQREYINLMNNYNNELENAVMRKINSMNELQNKIIIGMANIVESRDNNTGGHVKRTSHVVRIFVEKLQEYHDRLNITEDFCQKIVKAAPMHDLGKIAIDDSILRKPGKFTDEEYEIMKQHSEKGVGIIDSMLEGVNDKEFLVIAKNIAHYHHEKYDGCGYPCKLSGEDIPIEARIMALADVFDALVSKRCYKEKMTYDEAFSIIEKSCGSHFDPMLGKVFLECRPELEEYYDGMV